MGKSVTVQYRHVKVEDLYDGFHLKDMLVDVLKRSGVDGDGPIGRSAKRRIIDLDQDRTYVILNKMSEPASWSKPAFFGQLIHLERKASITAVTQSLDEDTNEFMLENLDIGADKNLLKGALYFVVIGNHLGIIEGQKVRGLTLERYLTSMLQSAEELEAGQNVVLVRKLSATSKTRMREVQELVMMPHRNVRSSDTAKQMQTIKRDGDKSDDTKTVIDILRYMHWPEEAIEALFGNVPDGGSLQSRISIMIKKPKRGSAPIARSLIEEGLRNVDLEEFGLKGEGSEKNGSVVIAEKTTVEQIGDLLDPTDAMAKIIELLHKWSKEGRIDLSWKA